MELQDLKAKYNTYDLTTGVTSTKWYYWFQHKKNILHLRPVLLLVFLGSSFFVGGYFIGVAARSVGKNSETITVLPFSKTPEINSSSDITHSTIQTDGTITESDVTSDWTPNPASSFSFSVSSVESSSSTFRKTSYGTTTESTYVHQEDIEWDGVCPKMTTKCPDSYDGKPPVVLVSLDGFHPDYMERGFTPTFKKLSQCGTSGQMYPVFPSKTFPSHYSIVTGLNPSSHGIIDNNMYDPAYGKMFKITTNESKQSYWYEGEPIWVTAINQGKKAACYFWPGSDVLIKGVKPTYYIPKYSSKIPFSKRVDQVLKWLAFPKEDRPDFLTLYVNQPDHNAHKSGTNSSQVNQALSNVDEMIKRLFAGLQQKGLLNCVDVIILSDHGMADTSCSRMVRLTDYINVSEIHMSLGPIGRLRPMGKFNLTAIQTILHNLQCKSENMQAYLKEQLPVRWHFSNHRRIEPIFLDTDSGWTISGRKYTKPDDPFCSGAAHGYDNYYEEMSAIFTAHGPSFKFHNPVEKFVSTELYEMMCELLNITASPNNGTKGSLHHFLKNPVALPSPDILEYPKVSDIPKDIMEYNCRIHSSHCECSKYDERQKDVENRIELDAMHMPFGMPYNSDNVSLNILYHKDYIAAFDHKYRMAMWSSFTLSEKFNVTDESPCWKGDARVTGTPDCADYNKTMVMENGILQRPLFPYDFATQLEEASFVTNSVPKFENHVLLIEKNFNEMITELYVEKGPLNVVTGPAFDINATGILPSIEAIMGTHATYGPLVMPTHYFYVISWCLNGSIPLKECHPNEVDVKSFILPNVPISYNCEAPQHLIRKHVARLVDIEGVTGISFFTELPTYEAIRLRTKVSK